MDRNKSRRHSPAINPSFRLECVYHHHRHLACFAHLVSFSYVGVSLTCIAYISTSDENTARKRAVYFIPPINWRRSGGCKHAFTVAKIAAQVSSTSSLALQNLKTISTFHYTDVCSSFRSTFFSEPSVNPPKRQTFGGTRSVSFIAFSVDVILLQVFRAPVVCMTEQRQ